MKHFPDLYCCLPSALGPHKMESLELPFFLFFSHLHFSEPSRKLQLEIAPGLFVLFLSPPLMLPRHCPQRPAPVIPNGVMGLFCRARNQSRYVCDAAFAAAMPPDFWLPPPTLFPPPLSCPPLNTRSRPSLPPFPVSTRMTYVIFQFR